MVDVPPSVEALRHARHQGWLAGVALRLGCGAPKRNPHERGTLIFVEWNIGFDEGFAG